MTGTTTRTAAKKVAVKKTTPAKRVVRKPKTESVGVAHELRAYVPSPAVAQQYVGRKVFGVWDIVIAEEAMKNGENIILSGHTGAGKTLFGEAFASRFGYLYYSMPCDVSIDPSAMIGKLQPTEKVGQAEWVDGPFTEVMRNGGVLNISEVNMMTPKIAAVLYPVLDGRRYLVLLGHKGEVVRAHRGTANPDRPCWCNLEEDDCNSKRVLIIADMNPNYRGTQELNAAFYNRFEYKIPWDYDAEVEEKLVQWPTVRSIAEKLRAMTGSELVTPTSTNMLMEFEKFTKRSTLGIDFAIENFVSAFHPNEREAVKKVIELDKDKIEKDMKFFANAAKGRKRVSDEDLEEMDFEFGDED